MSVENNPESDQFAVLRAEMDQAVAAAAEMARAVAAYYDGLMREGFSPEQALALVLGWQNALLSGGRSEPA